MTRTTIRLPKALRERAIQLAKARSVSLARLIRVSLARHLDAENSSYAADPIFSETAVFRGPDVPRDGARNHDTYVYGFEPWPRKPLRSGTIRRVR